MNVKKLCDMESLILDLPLTAKIDTEIELLTELPDDCEDGVCKL